MTETITNGGPTVTTSIVTILFTPDLEYDLIQYLPPELPKKGRQCGKCGMRFDYGSHYGFMCGQHDCPAGYGPR